MTPEGKVKAAVDKMLSQLKVFVYSPQAGPYGSAGIPDRLVCANGRFIGIEVKADATKHPTRLQKQCMAKIEAHGGVCFVVCNNETLEAARAAIKNILSDA